MSQQQTEEMLFDPSNGSVAIEPTNAAEWREFHGKVAWLYNPWTRAKRDPRDIGSDVFGHLIIPPNEPVRA